MGKWVKESCGLITFGSVVRVSGDERKYLYLDSNRYLPFKDHNVSRDIINLTYEQKENLERFMDFELFKHCKFSGGKESYTSMIALIDELTNV